MASAYDVAVSLKRPSRFAPSRTTPTMTTTAISDAMRAYSTEVAPRSPGDRRRNERRNPHDCPPFGRDHPPRRASDETDIPCRGRRRPRTSRLAHGSCVSAQDSGGGLGGRPLRSRLLHLGDIALSGRRARVLRPHRRPRSGRDRRSSLRTARDRSVR